MTRVTIAVALVLSLAACGKSDEENSSTNNGTNSGTNGTNGTNSGTTLYECAVDEDCAEGELCVNRSCTPPSAGDCSWGELLASCGGGQERDLSQRAIGCIEWWGPTDASVINQDELCSGAAGTGSLWDEKAPCSTAGLNGRRPIGCCWELVDEIYTRHCYYDDPLNLESSAMTAQEACEGAGFCWVDLQM